MAYKNVDQNNSVLGGSPEVVGSGSAQSILPGIEHVVVLMFENRSFDNVLGGLYPGKPQSEYNGLTGVETNPHSIPARLRQCQYKCSRVRRISTR